MKARWTAAAGLLLLAAALPLRAGGSKLTFTKAFPGSVPAYCSVQVDRSGALEYKESPTDDQPVKAQLPEPDIASLFDLAEKLGYFKTPVESGLKVANTGKKVFRYQSDDGASSEVTFNYSLDPTAQQLLERFERIAATERSYIDLDRTVHFDKLGVNDSLAEIESLWLRKELAAPLQFVPLLTRIANRESFMHMVRERAAKLKEAFEAGPVPETATGKQK